MLHTEYRPDKWDDIVGNESTVASLQKELKKKNHSHSFMFHGPYGTGKTTFARLISKELKCSEQNILEYNMADNTGVDEARKIIASVKYSPLVLENESKVKVYIFDEFHRATPNAQDCLLKTLEEPPNHAYFILCTTEPSKIVKTIQSRCAKFETRRLRNDEMAELLDRIIEKEGLNTDIKVIKKIIKTANGHPRDALQLLNQVSKIKDVDLALDLIPHGAEEAEIIEVCRLLFKKSSWSSIAECLNRVKVDPEKSRIACFSYFTSIMMNEKSGVSTVQKAALIAEEFEKPFFYAGKQSLIMACYRANQID